GHAPLRSHPTRASVAKPALGRPIGLRKWLYRLAAGILVPTLLFGLLEASLRICGYGYPTAFFIKPAQAWDGIACVSNYDFNRRFFPPGLARTPIPLSLPMVKPDGSYRIFFC